MSLALQEFNPPQWAKQLKHIPKQKLQLASPNTPIHEWNLAGVPPNFSLSIKRDDMAGITLTGNKVRKLEFYMAEALNQNCQHVITCGGGIQSNHCRTVAICARQLGMTPHLVLFSDENFYMAEALRQNSQHVITCGGCIQSNHCRTVAICARQLGMTPHIVLFSDENDPNVIGCESNLVLYRMCAAHMYMVPLERVGHSRSYLDMVAQNIKSTTGETCYQIPYGGSDELGTWGYITAFEELIQQGALDKFDDLVLTSGSGGTAAGLAIGNFLTGSKLRIHAIPISTDSTHKHVNEMLESFGINQRSEDILNVIDGHMGKGYGLSTQEELDFIVQVGSTTGIMLDPVYTGKAVKGLLHELRHNPDTFKGSRILFLHTGGLFGLFDGRINGTLKQANATANLVNGWTNNNDSPV